ncbi:MAG: type VI secretion system tube protein Hcp [Verrucomicrobiae bacterium]|nr:type VI secretion system tube protein Hcp [Verrucomicrobiae bacterium]
MATNYFLQVKGITGECTDKKHKDWMEVIEYQHGVVQESGATQAATGAHSTGRGQHENLKIIKYLDKSSPNLALYCSKGQHIDEVKLELNKMINGKQCPYMEYKLSKVLITSVKPRGVTVNNDSLPTEEVTFRYNKIEWTYTAYDDKGNTAGKTTASWDLTANEG